VLLAYLELARRDGAAAALDAEEGLEERRLGLRVRRLLDRGRPRVEPPGPTAATARLVLARPPPAERRRAGGAEAWRGRLRRREAEEASGCGCGCCC
jgi:hypothetical protein